MKRVWAFLKRIPLGVWAALGVALALLELYLRGRRLDADLARVRLERDAARAKAGVAKDQGRAEVHLEKARNAELKIEELETARALAASASKKEEQRLSALPADQVHAEYMKMLEREREKLGAK